MPMTGHGGFRGPGNIEQDRDSEIATLGPRLHPDAVLGLTGCKEVAHGAYRPLGVEVVAIGVAGGGDAGGPQRLELALHGADAGHGTRIAAERRDYRFSTVRWAISPAG